MNYEMQKDQRQRYESLRLTPAQVNTAFFTSIPKHNQIFTVLLTVHKIFYSIIRLTALIMPQPLILQLISSLQSVKSVILYRTCPFRASPSCFPNINGPFIKEKHCGDCNWTYLKCPRALKYHTWALTVSEYITHRRRRPFKIGYKRRNDPVNLHAAGFTFKLKVKHYRGLQCQIRVKSRAERASAHGDGATEKRWQSDNIVWKFRWLSVIRGPCCGWLGPSPRRWQKNVTWEQRNCRLQLPSDIHGEKCFGTRTNTSRSDFWKRRKTEICHGQSSQGKGHSTSSIGGKVFILNILEHEDYKQWDFFIIFVVENCIFTCS